MRARNARLALATVLAEGFLGRLTFGMVSFAMPLYAHKIGLSLSLIGILVSIRTLCVLPLKPVAGWLADRIGVRRVYLLGIFARTLSAAMLLFAGGFAGLMAVRLLQGASAAGRDVASLGVIARDAASRVGTAYGSYASAKHVGGVAGAGLAGLIIAASGGAYQPLFVIVLCMSLLPMAAAWIGLREEPGSSPASEPEPETVQPSTADDGGKTGWIADTIATLRELAGPASVGMMVATSAYMVHGLFPILATQYAGLSEAEAGLIYSFSAAFFLVGGPLLRVADRPLRSDLRHRLALRRQHRLILHVYRIPELHRAGGGPFFRRLREGRVPPGVGLDDSRNRIQRPAEERPPPRSARHLPERRRGDRSCPGHHIVAIRRRVRAVRGADRDRRCGRDHGAARLRGTREACAASVATRRRRWP